MWHHFIIKTATGHLMLQDYLLFVEQMQSVTLTVVEHRIIILIEKSQTNTEKLMLHNNITLKTISMHWLFILS